MSVRRSVALALVVAVMTSVVPVAAQDGGKAAVAREPGLPDQTYRIGPEDVLQISVWKNDAISRAVPVRPDGKITLPLLNDVQAAGLTPMELRAFLMEKLAEYIPNPEVSVIVTGINSFRVSVIGEVMRPGRYDLKSWTTVLELLAQAGGLTQFASRGRIVVLRPLGDGKGFQRLPFNYNTVISAGGEQHNFLLHSGDILLVP